MRWYFLDTVPRMNPGVCATGIRTFSGSEPFFRDHFPGFPVVPGVLQIEMVAQLGGLCVRQADSELFPVLSSVKKARFHHWIEPGDRAVVTVDVMMRKSYSLVRGNVTVNGRLVSEAEVMLAYVPKPAGKADGMAGKTDSETGCYEQNPVQ